MNRRKSITLAILIVLLLTFAVSGTIAYLTTKTGSVTNVFTPATVDTTITEDVFGGTTKSGVKVTNNGDIPVFVRAKVIANWYKDGQIVAAWMDDVSYNEKWLDGDDGYRYYKEILEPGKSTAALFDSYSYEAEEVPVVGAHLEMRIIHQSIQAEGWPEGVDTAQEAFVAAKN